MTAITIGKVASKIYRYLPNDEKRFLEIMRSLLMNKKYGYFSVATLWMKRRVSIIHPRNMDYFENIVLHVLQGWAEVDQFCYRVMNPAIELDSKHYEYLLKWSLSENKDVRRVSLVSMIHTQRGGLRCDYDFDKMIFLVERLKNDTDIHVKKAVGWVLKCSYLSYPDQVEKYLRDNVGNLERLIFRYALEHVENPLRHELISLEVK